jgi:hypothetical protein
VGRRPDEETATLGAYKLTHVPAGRQLS